MHPLPEERQGYEGLKKVHLIGIGGVGMAGLAVLLQSRGREVSGCDIGSGPRTRWLESLGIRVEEGHDPAHLDGVDEVIVTPAVAQDNPEYIRALSLSVPVRRRGEVLAEIVNFSPDSIVVCGSHGKTTTSTFIAKLLSALGERVSWAIGGECREFPVAADNGGVLVVEGDESDGTLALYRAGTLVVTNVEYDHPDHFPTVADYEAVFNQARSQAREVIEGGADNAETAVRVALSRGHALADIERVLPSVTATLPDRRFQELADGVWADYAHHPSEIRYTLNRARKLCRGKLRVLFQPHRFSRTKALKNDFAAALSLADEVMLCPTYSAFEHPVEGGDVADLYAQCRATFGADDGTRARLARSCAEAWEHARNSAAPGDMTFLLGAGDIIQLKDEVTSRRLAPPRRIFIGAGSNTWKSDLKLNVEYVKTAGPAGLPGAAHPLLASHFPWMAGIPGTLGGWVKMNAGAFGHSISEVIEAVMVDGRWIHAAECGFGYRASSIDGEIQDVRFVSVGPSVEGVLTPNDYLVRRVKFPAGTYGSFFKNPQGDYAGRLLEAAGAKGMRVGGAYVWENHANVIVRGETATASDVLALARIMHNAVFFRFGLSLEPEVTGVVI